MKDLHKLIPVDKFDSGGRCDEIKGTLIKKLVFDIQAKLCVEIGVFKGSSLMYFAESLQSTNGIIIGIDPYSIDSFKNIIPDPSLHDYIYNVVFTEQEILDEIYYSLKNIITQNNLTNLVKLVRDKSENYHKKLEDESIDILHIDGNHDEDFVKKDVLLYLPLVKKGGYILMDDISWPGVEKNINNYLSNQCQLISKIDDFAIFKKNT
jgi:predicted O-methyltransferase YrrM